MADLDRRPAFDPDGDALARAGSASFLAAAPTWRAACDRDLDRLLGRLRLLHRDVRPLQQDLGIAVGGDCHIGLAVADRTRPLARRGAECGSGAAGARVTSGSRLLAVFGAPEDEEVDAVVERPRL